MRPLALKWRMAILTTLALTAVIATVSIVAYVEMEQFLIGSIHRSLGTEVEAVAAVLDDRQGPEHTELELRSVTGASPHKRSARFRIWRDGASDDAFASHPPDSEDGRWMRTLAAEAGPVPSGAVFLDAERPSGPFEVLWVRRPSNGGTVNIMIAASSQYARHEMHEFLKLLLILGGAMALGSGAVAMGIVWTGMRPIARTAEIMRSVTARNLAAARPANGGSPPELRPFVEALEAMLARLDAAMQRQKQFTGDASHELRTPLTLAKSTLQATLSRDRSAEEYRRAIEETLRDIDRMERLTGQLLTLARMDETEPPLDETTALDALLRELAAAHSQRAGARVVCGPLSPARVPAREGELRPLFDNLLDNALRHGPAGGSVRIDLRNDGPARVVVTVHDEGGRIPPEALPRLFDRFYRVDSARSTDTGGTGLGLAIARAVVDRCGGAIEIASGPEQGTTVTVVLPARSA